MAKLLTEESSLISIADAIRAKTGKAESIAYPEGFVSEIGGISGGGSDFDVFRSVVNLNNGVNMQIRDATIPVFSANVGTGRNYIIAHYLGDTYANNGIIIFYGNNHISYYFGMTSSGGFTGGTSLNSFHDSTAYVRYDESTGEVEFYVKQWALIHGGDWEIIAF